MDPRPTPAHPVSLDSANPPEFLAVKSGIRLPQKVFELRDQLNHKAKQEPKFRFYALYDRRYRRDVLLAAWWLVVKNEGAPGVDGVSFESIDDPAPLLEELHELLRTKTYEPLPVLRVSIPKPDGRRTRRSRWSDADSPDAGNAARGSDLSVVGEH